MLHSAYNLAEYRMLAVQMRLRGIADVKLAAARIPSRMRHREGTALMFVWIDFTINGIARSAGACSVRAAALSYKAWNNAMEDKSVVKAGVCELLKICYRIWSVLIEQVKNDFSAVRKCDLCLFSH